MNALISVTISQKWVPCEYSDQPFSEIEGDLLIYSGFFLLFLPSPVAWEQPQGICILEKSKLTTPTKGSFA